MRTKASLAGHPIHPMLVVIPLGALPTALVFDVLQVWIGPQDWRIAGFVASCVGVAGIVLAAIPGFVDFRKSVPKRGAVHAVARAHMGLGLALLGYFALVTLLRWATLESPSPWAAWMTLAASAFGNLGLIAQGYLGGELRARHRLGVDSSVPEALVAPARPPEVPEEGPGRKRGPYGGGGAPGAP
jgi:uncharacterized membrane protein